jgi:hypothetical protein
MNTNIKETATYKMVCEEARVLSWKLLNRIYVIQRGNSLITSMSVEKGTVLTSFKLGNQL